MPCRCTDPFVCWYDFCGAFHLLLSPYRPLQCTTTFFMYDHPSLNVQILPSSCLPYGPVGHRYKTFGSTYDLGIFVFAWHVGVLALRLNAFPHVQYHPSIRYPSPVWLLYIRSVWHFYWFELLYPFVWIGRFGKLIDPFSVWSGLNSLFVRLPPFLVQLPTMISHLVWRWLFFHVETKRIPVLYSVRT